MFNLSQFAMDLRVQISCEYAQNMTPNGEVCSNYSPKSITITHKKPDSDEEFWTLRSINGNDYELSVEGNFTEVISIDKDGKSMSVAQLIMMAENACNYIEQYQ